MRIPIIGDNEKEEGELNMPKNYHNQFKNNQIGTQPRGFGGNKGKKMQDTSGKHAQVMQTKGE